MSDIKCVKSVENFGEMLAPLSKIFLDRDMWKIIKDKGIKGGDVIPYIIKSHPADIAAAACLYAGKDVETYDPTPIEIGKVILELFNDEDVNSLFISPVKKSENVSTGKATVNAKNKKSK
jgi:hypothetical protein